MPSNILHLNLTDEVTELISFCYNRHDHSNHPAVKNRKKSKRSRKSNPANSNGGNKNYNCRKNQ